MEESSMRELISGRLSHTRRVSASFETVRGDVGSNILRSSFSTRRSKSSLRMLSGNVSRDGDVKQVEENSLRYETFHFDPLALLKLQPSKVSVEVCIKKSAILLGRKGWERVTVDLKGAMLVVRAKDTQPSVINILGCSVIPIGSDSIKLKKPKSSISISIRFDHSFDCNRWEHFLEEAASQRYVGHADFSHVSLISMDPGFMKSMVKDETSGELLQLKSISKTTVFRSAHNHRRAVDERLMLELGTANPLLSQLRYAFQGKDKVYLATELSEAGNLDYFISTNGILSEDQGRYLLAQVIIGLEFVHAHGFVHRNIRMSSIMLAQSGHVRLGGFDYCLQISSQKALNAELTDLPLSALPCLDLEYGVSLDLWMLGILTVEILHGMVPTSGFNVDEFLRDTKNTLSDSAQMFLRQILSPRPETRLGCGVNGIRELRQHEFFRDINWRGVEKRENHQDLLWRDKVSCASLSRDMSDFAVVHEGNLTEQVEYDVFSDVTLWPLTRPSKHVVSDGVLVGWFFSRGRLTDVLR